MFCGELPVVGCGRVSRFTVSMLSLWRLVDCIIFFYASTRGLRDTATTDECSAGECSTSPASFADELISTVLNFSWSLLSVALPGVPLGLQVVRLVLVWVGFHCTPKKTLLT